MGGGESSGVPDRRGPGHRHRHRAAPPVELQHLRRALEADHARAARHAPHVFLCEGQVEAERHELSHGVLAPAALITGYVGVNMSGDQISILCGNHKDIFQHWQCTGLERSDESIERCSW